MARAAGRAPRAWERSIPVALGASAAADVSIVLAPGRTVAGVVRDERGRPVSGVQIRVTHASATEETSAGERGSEWSDDEATYAFPDKRPTTKDGRFELLDVSWHLDAGSTVVLTTSHPGYAVTLRSGIERLEAGVDGVVTLDLVVERGRSLRGTVVDAAGTPVRGAVVSVSPPAMSFYIVRRRSETDDEGRFAIEALPRAEVTITVAAVLFEGVRETVDLQRDDVDRRWILTAGAAVGGLVIDESGALAVGERVTLVDTDEHYVAEAITDETGRFPFGGVPAAFAGGWVLFGHRGGEPVSGPGEDIEIRMRPYTRLRLRLLDARDGSPITAPTDFDRRFPAELSWNQGLTGSSARVDDDGVAALEVDPVAPVSVDVRIDGYRVTSVRFDPAVALERGGLDVPLTPAEPVRGVVRDPTGEPVAGVRIRQMGWRSHSSKREAWTDDDGRFETDAVDDDAWLMLAHDAYAPTVTTLACARDTAPSTTLDLTLHHGARYEGRVTDEQGRPVAGVSVSVRRLGPEGRLPIPWPAAVTGADGRYRIERAPPGSVSVACDGAAATVTTEDGGTGCVDLRIDRALR